jgi:hypothetical protein
MRRCGERMASKAARQEPTTRGYHIGKRIARTRVLREEMCPIKKDFMGIESLTIIGGL